jgi:hypothetical protein
MPFEAGCAGRLAFHASLPVYTNENVNGSSVIRVMRRWPLQRPADAAALHPSLLRLYDLPSSRCRVALGVATQGSHRSVRAQLRHTALQVIVWRRGEPRPRYAIRCGVVNTDIGVRGLRRVAPQRVDDSTPLFPSRGPSEFGSPAAAVLLRCSDFRPPFPPRFVVLRLAVPTRAPVFAPVIPTPEQGLEHCGLAAPRQFRCGSETIGSPRFLASPLVPTPRP